MSKAIVYDLNGSGHFISCQVARSLLKKGFAKAVTNQKRFTIKLVPMLKKVKTAYAFENDPEMIQLLRWAHEGPRKT